MKKILPAMGFLLFLTAAIGITVFVAKNQQGLKTSAAPATSVSLEPATITKVQGETFTVAVMVNTGQNQIVSVDLILLFNPQVVTATTVSQGTFLSATQEVHKIIDNNAGKITYSFYAMKENAKSGQGSLAVITFQGKAVGNGDVHFGPQTAAYGLTEGQNILVSTQNGTYRITAQTTAPAPSADITPSPSLAISIQPTLTTRIPPSPTSSPTPVSIKTPTATTNASPTRIPTSKLTNNSNPTLPPVVQPAIPVAGTAWPTLTVGFIGLTLILAAGVFLF